MADVAGPWWVVIAAGVPSAVSGAWVIWRWWVERTDKRDDTGMTREQRIQDDLDKRAARLAKEDADLFERLKTELDRKDRRIVDLERDVERLEADRDRGWDLVRYWNRRAHELRHACANTFQAMLNRLPPGATAPECPDLTLVGLEDPFPLGRPGGSHVPTDR